MNIAAVAANLAAQSALRRRREEEEKEQYKKTKKEEVVIDQLLLQGGTGFMDLRGNETLKSVFIKYTHYYNDTYNSSEKYVIGETPYNSFTEALQALVETYKPRSVQVLADGANADGVYRYAVIMVVEK